MTEETRKIHWLGAGLASVPGIRRLIAKQYPLVLWERDMAKAKVATKGLAGSFEIRDSASESLEDAINAGDVVVSMLPTTMHFDVAKLCLAKKAHFACSSYISPEMQTLDNAVKETGLSFINEVGLDPGIDHLFAHLLMDDYRKSAHFDPQNDHDFQSYCGGFPSVANDFKYKFSWSPLGVLKALKSPAKAILNGVETEIDRPWHAIKDYPVDLVTGLENFQSYPNRNSLPFMEHYGFDESWNIERFVRGTLRLDGWAEAWKDIFKTIETTASDKIDAVLQAMSEKLWAEQAYAEDEFDRVVLSVEMKVSRNGITLWHKSKSIDSLGNRHASAMARLVSIPVSLATEAAWKGELETGVQAAPSDPATIRAWLETIAEHGDLIRHTDHLMQSRMIAAE